MKFNATYHCMNCGRSVDTHIDLLDGWDVDDVRIAGLCPECVKGGKRWK